MTHKMSVLITGSSSGFGYLTAKTLAKEGLELYVLEMDVTDEKSVNKAVTVFNE